MQSLAAWTGTWFLPLSARGRCSSCNGSGGAGARELRRRRAGAADRVPGVAWVLVFLGVTGATLALGASWLLALST